MSDLINKPRILIHTSKSLNYTIYDVNWIPSSPRFLVGGCTPRQQGALQMYTLGASGDKIEQVSSRQLPSPIQSMTFGHCRLGAQREVALARFDGQLQVYDIERLGSDSSESLIYDVRAHDSTINRVAGCGRSYGAPELATCSRDGIVRVWDTRQRSKPVASLEPEDGSPRVDSWAVAFGNSFNDTERVVCAGYENGDLKLFDLRMNQLRWETNIRNGICSLQFDRDDIKMNKLLATTLEGRFMVFDMKTFNQEHDGYAQVTERVSSNTMWVGKHLPQNRDVWAVTGGAGQVFLYQYHYPDQRQVGEPPRGVPGRVELIQKQTVSSQPVNAWDWHRDKEGLAVMASFDQTIYVCIVTKLDKYR